MPEINPNAGDAAANWSSIAFQAGKASLDPVVDAPQKTAPKDTQAAMQIEKIDRNAANPTTPILPAPVSVGIFQLTNPVVYNVLLLQTGGISGAMAALYAQMSVNILTTAQEMEKTAVKTSESIPKDNPASLTLMEFIKTIRSLIQQLKEALAKNGILDSQSDQKTAKGASDERQQKLDELSEKIKKNFDEQLKAREKVREERKSIAKSNQLNLVAKIFQPICALFLTPVPILGLAFCIMSIVDSVPGKTNGWMNKMFDSLDKTIDSIAGNKIESAGTRSLIRMAVIMPLFPIAPGIVSLVILQDTKLSSKAVAAETKERADKLEDIIESNDFFISNIKSALQSVPEDEAAILEMIALLMKMLQKALIGLASGEMDTKSFEKDFSHIKSIKNLPAELLKQNEKLEQTLSQIPDGFLLFPNASKEEIEASKKEFIATMLEINRYKFYRAHNDPENAKQSLVNAEGMSAVIASKMLKDPELSVVTKTAAEAAKAVVSGGKQDIIHSQVSPA